MAGAIAGTSLINLGKSEKLEVVTVTVNNECGGGCPQCYLQYNGENYFIPDITIDNMLAGEFRHLAIVGKEPLFNASHAEKTEALARRAGLAGKTISIITNGMNLDLLKHPEYFSFIDVSFDGGKMTYPRKGIYEKIISNIRSLEKSVKFNSLHTLYAENMDAIDDMVRVGDDADFGIIMFSPYLLTKNDGINYVSPVSVEDVLRKASESKSFMDSKNTLLNIDIFHSEQQKVGINLIKRLIEEYGMRNKVALFESDTSRNVVRVTYDGFVMTPRDSLNPAEYGKRMKLEQNINEAHEALLR